MTQKKTSEELRRLMELRRSNAASAVPSKKTYNRKKLSDPNAIIKERK